MSEMSRETKFEVPVRRSCAGPSVDQVQRAQNLQILAVLTAGPLHGRELLLASLLAVNDLIKNGFFAECAGPLASLTHQVRLAALEQLADESGHVGN